MKSVWREDWRIEVLGNSLTDTIRSWCTQELDSSQQASQSELLTMTSYPLFQKKEEEQAEGGHILNIQNPTSLTQKTLEVI